MSEQQQQPGQPTEEELRAAYEQQLKQIKVDDVLIQTILSLINLGSLRAGVVPGNENEADPDQRRQAIEGVRALLPLVEPALGPDAKQVRDALSQLQLAYARSGAKPPPGAPKTADAATEKDAPTSPPKPGDPDSAVSSGRLWVPGR